MISATLALVIVIIAVALIFDYINGFHDAANSVATIVATRVLSPFQAVLWAAWWNFIAAVPLLIGIEGAKVAKTVGSGMVAAEYSADSYVILAGLLGAIVWDLITWWFGLPTSSSHALIGGYAGAAMGKAMVTGAPLLGTIVVSGWVKTLFFIVLAPVLGMALAYVLMISVFWLFRRSSPSYMDVWFRRLQLLSAALFSYSHGANDAQKTMGIMTGALLAGGFITEFHVQPWVVFAAHAAISLGTMTGGWRIVHTMGGKLTRLKPRGGFCAETAGAMAILFPTYLGIPVSTTHVITGAIAGVGSIQRPKAVRWKLAQNILWAWLMTLPASAAVAAVCYLVVRLFA
jgi:PiT family inorganic phosphate transporter